MYLHGIHGWCNMRSMICLLFLSKWENPQFLEGFVLLSFFVDSFVCCILLFVCFYFNFKSCRCHLIFDSWVWMSIFCLLPLFLLYNSAYIEELYIWYYLPVCCTIWYTPFIFSWIVYIFCLSFIAQCLIFFFNDV